MSCTLTNNEERIRKNLQGGISTVYLFPFVKYNRSQIGLTEQVLTSFPTTEVYKYHSINTNYSENVQEDGGDLSWTQSFSIEIPRTYETSEVYKMVKQYFRAIFIDRLGNIRILGLYNGLKVTVNNETGADKSGFNGYKITFDGLEDNQAYFLDNLDDFPVLVEEKNYIFMSCNNYTFMSGNNYIF